MTIFDQAAALVLLNPNLTTPQRTAKLRTLQRQADREVGAPSEPCARCGNRTYARIDGDLLCEHCGLPHGEDDED